ncbi:glycine betaine ABC transporter substrate-binding protein [Streptomyces physcomitrii]|uniref:glycine betaine ABC transporter substrate-binding protein n=1 Tax=Streptomyces physcomitrii TaxID=2724184 RepID=UPI003420F9E5
MPHQARRSVRPPAPLRRTGAALAALAALTLSSCSAESGSTSVSTADLRGGSLSRDVDLSGARFTVGSKEFTEQKILGKITLYALRAAGARTADQTGLNGSAIVRAALESGDVDLYWEYAGTGWTQYLGHDKPVAGERAQYRATSTQDAKRNGIRWLGPAAFGDQYAIARAADAEGPVGEVDRLSQLKDLADGHRDKLTLCGASEFLDRELGPFQKTYGIEIPSAQVYQNAFALNFVNVAKGSPCQFAEVFTTDSRLESLDLTVIEDDRHHFTSEPAALTVREKTLKDHPELEKLARALGTKLTEKTVIKLLGMVDQDGKTPDEAALYFLRENGFIGR